MAKVTDEDRRQALMMAGSIKFRGQSIAELPDGAANVVEGLAKEFSLIRERAYFRGIRDGVQRFAWWRDGVQYVGTTGRTLNQALNEVDTQESEAKN